jgi:membrane-associated HD superfamily phosphohydrolase
MSIAAKTDEIPADGYEQLKEEIKQDVEQELRDEFEQKFEAEREQRRELEQKFEAERKQRRDQIHAVARERHEERKQTTRYREAQRRKHERIDEEIGETHIEEPPSTLELHEERLDALSDSMDRLRAGSVDTEPINDGKSTVYRPETDLERLLDDPDLSGIRITESVSRALTIAGQFERWADTVSAGRVITEDLKTLVNTALDDTLSWKQVHRACHKLEELTNGHIEFRTDQRHGRVLVMEQKDWLSSLSRVVSEGRAG